jgi:DNA-binding transcriptional MerR regulator
MSKLLIGDLVRETGRSHHTIRWYEKQGLIPNVTRDSGNRRVYDFAHIEWLAFLDRLRRSGMSIKDMRSYAMQVKEGHGSLDSRQSLLSLHRSRISAKIGELGQALAIIDAKLEYYALWERTRKRPAAMPSARSAVMWNG